MDRLAPWVVSASRWTNRSSRAKENGEIGARPLSQQQQQHQQVSSIPALSMEELERAEAVLGAQSEGFADDKQSKCLGR